MTNGHEETALGLTEAVRSTQAREPSVAATYRELAKDWFERLEQAEQKGK